MKLIVLSTGSKGNGYALVDNSGNKLLIEAGVKIQALKEGLNFDLNNIHGCLISHEHGDHAHYIKNYALISRIYSMPETIAKFAMPDKMNVGRYYELTQKKKIGPFTVSYFDTIHDAAHPVGFIIQHKECGTIVYCTDMAYMPEFNGQIDHLIIEVNYCEEILALNVENGFDQWLAQRIQETHFSLEKAIKFIDGLAVPPKTITCIHLSDTNSSEKLVKETLMAKFGCIVNIARNGDVYNF